jgi:nitrite reductase (NADH) small subunit
MAQFTKITTQSELPPLDEAKEFSCGDQAICIANVEGVYSAMDNVCAHRGGPLAEGMVRLGKVVCPWHGWAWDPKTGVPEQDARMKTKIYPMKFEGDDVLVELDLPA